MRCKSNTFFLFLQKLFESFFELFFTPFTVKGFIQMRKTKEYYKTINRFCLQKILYICTKNKGLKMEIVLVFSPCALQPFDFQVFFLWRIPDSNRSPLDCQSNALAK